MLFVKPNAIKLDPRAQEEKDRELAYTTVENLHHIQKQLVTHGHSLETLLATAAKNTFGVVIQPHKPAEKQEAA